MKTFLFTFLCVSILIKSSFETHPRYSYVCKEDGSVEFTGFKANSKVTISNSTFNGTDCNDKPAGVVAGRNFQVVNIPANCMGTNLKVNRTIEIKVIDTNLLEKTRSPVVNSTIIGGLNLHTFVLQCSHITAVNRTVLRQFHLLDKEIILSKENEIGQVDMRFKADDDINLPDISEVYIGDEFYMFLQYKGVSDYVIEPQNCTAFEGNDIYDNKILKETLWDTKLNPKGNCITDKANQLDLLGSKGFRYLDNKTVRTRLNGFRFKNNGKDITIFCRVSLKLPTGSKTKDQAVCTGTSAGRRKRSTDSRNTKSLAVMQTLSVKDRSSQGYSFAPRTVAQVTIVIASFFVIRIL